MGGGKAGGPAVLGSPKKEIRRDPVSIPSPEPGLGDPVSTLPYLLFYGINWG